MRLSRRGFIKGVGAGSASLLLNQAEYLYAAGGPPPRFVFVIEGNGLIPRFLASPTTIAAINAAGGTIGPNDYGDLNKRYGHQNVLNIGNASLASAPALVSLAPTFQGDLSVENDARVVLGLSSKVAGGGHTSHYGALSCSQSAKGVPSYATIDHVLGSIPAVRGETPFDVVRMGIHSSSTTPFNYDTCATGLHAPAPLICNPSTAYSNLFGSIAAGEGAEAFNNRGLLLDFALADVDANLARFNGKPQLQAKIEKYGEAVEQLTARHARILGMQAQLTAVAPDGPDESPLYTSTGLLDHLEVMFDLTKAALLGGLTNVVVIGSGTGGAFDLNYSRLGYSNIGRHDLCHANDYTALLAISEFHISLATRLAKSLKAVPEGSGSMLDNTVIVCMSDNGEKHHSNSEEWPMLILGGSGLGLGAGNRSIVYPRYTKPNNRQVSNVFNSLAYIAGQPLDTFGNDTHRVAEGPLSEL